MLKFAIVGFGSRGQCFGKLIGQDKDACLYAVAEPVEKNIEKAVSMYGVKRERCFRDSDAFFSQPKMCDAVFICTQDAQHYADAMRALELGYDVCLEKPAAVTIEQCIGIRDKARELGRKVMLTHVLRYAPFFIKIKELIDGGGFGKVMTINLTENIAYWHFALGFVRGPWRNMEESTPTIVAKCCHDLDLLVWFMGEKCKAVSSYGGLSYYKAENAPKGSAEHCADCQPAVKEKCLYNSYKIYPERVKNPVVGGMSGIDIHNVNSVLDSKSHPWSRCVFHSDNDAVDHQVVNMLFESGATAHLTMTAFSNECYRYIKVHGTQGEAYGNLDDGILYYTAYGKPREVIDLNKTTDVTLADGHGGGDLFLYKDFCDYIAGKATSRSRTSIETSIESHIIGFKAEESRKLGGENMIL